MSAYGHPLYQNVSVEYTHSKLNISIDIYKPVTIEIFNVQLFYKLNPSSVEYKPIINFELELCKFFSHGKSNMFFEIVYQTIISKTENYFPTKCPFKLVS